MNIEELREAVANDEDLEYHFTGGETNFERTGIVPGWYPCSVYKIRSNGTVEIGVKTPRFIALEVTVLKRNIPIAFRKQFDNPLHVGVRVRILCDGELRGETGTIYNYLPSRPAPWHVRPDTWPRTQAGIAYKMDELELIDEPMNQHARRRLFFAAMRRPEMRLVRAALRDMRWDKNVDWRDITSMEILPQSEWSTTWVLLTDKYESICLWPEHLRLDFHLWRLHDAADPACPCEYCQRGREMCVNRAEVGKEVA